MHSQGLHGAAELLIDRAAPDLRLLLSVLAFPASCVSLLSSFLAVCLSQSSSTGCPMVETPSGALDAPGHLGQQGSCPLLLRGPHCWLSFRRRLPKSPTRLSEREPQLHSDQPRGQGICCSTGTEVRRPRGRWACARQRGVEQEATRPTLRRGLGLFWEPETAPSTPDILMSDGLQLMSDGPQLMSEGLGDFHNRPQQLSVCGSRPCEEFFDQPEEGSRDFILFVGFGGPLSKGGVVGYFGGGAREKGAFGRAPSGTKP